ncbi:MAG: plasmid stabilization system [Pedosphaera sp.]|nr:plasmid stabilization system [Pedosphaera sp.]
MANLKYDPLAKEEIKLAIVYYESCREGLGKAFLSVIESSIQKFLLNPFRYRKISGRFRRCLVERFPYGIIFSVEEDFIFIAAVMHLNREPGYWKERIKAP